MYYQNIENPIHSYFTNLYQSLSCNLWLKYYLLFMHHKKASEVKLFQTVVTRCQWWAGQGMPRALV